MSYVLFGQTSSANGTRDKWAGANTGESGDVNNKAMVGGKLVDVANSTFNEAALANDIANNRQSYKISGGLETELQTQLDASGNVLKSAGANVVAGANDRTLADGSGLSNKELKFALNDQNWNDIKNVEVRIDSADTGSTYETLTLRNFVDSRVKIGDTTCFTATDYTSGLKGTMNVNIENAKRGQLDASQADMGVNAKIAVWTNDSGWQNSFSNQGSVFNDTFKIEAGKIGVVAGVSEFGKGAGVLADGVSTYDGSLTTLFTNLGVGNDTYDASQPGLRTIDYVWGGSDKDTILGGGGNDVLFGDFGTYASGSTIIGQDDDPQALTIQFGKGAGEDGLADWTVDGALKIWQQNSGGEKTYATAANWDNFLLESTYSQGAPVNSGVGVGTNVNGNGQTYGTGVENPEVNNTDALGFDFAKAVSGVKVGLGHFYSVEDEKMIVDLMKGGQKVGTLEIGADNSVTVISGDFTGSMTGYAQKDKWDGDHVLTITGKNGASFDGLVMKGVDTTVNGNPFDFYVSDLKATYAKAEDDDYIEGGAGNDYIDGGAGNDMLYGDGTNMLVNGGFESFTMAAGTWGQIGNNKALYGWQNGGDSVIEVWGTGFNGQDAVEGKNFIELDANGPSNGGVNASDEVFQTVKTVNGEVYELSLDAALRKGSAADTQTIEVYWNNTLVKSFDPASTEWTTYKFTVKGTGGMDKLSFREVTGDNNSYGGLIDNVKLIAAGNDTIVDGTGTDTVIAGRDTGSYAVTSSSYNEIGGKIGGSDVNLDVKSAADLLADWHTDGAKFGLTISASADGGKTFDDKFFSSMGDYVTFRGDANMPESWGLGVTNGTPANNNTQVAGNPEINANPNGGDQVAVSFDVALSDLKIDMSLFYGGEQQSYGASAGEVAKIQLLDQNGNQVGADIFAQASGNGSFGTSNAGNFTIDLADNLFAGNNVFGFKLVGYEPAGSDGDANDYLLQGVQAKFREVTVKNGDKINLTNDKTKDTIIYNKGDGVDVITGFNKADGDKLNVKGFGGAGDFTISKVMFNGHVSTLIETADPNDHGAIILDNVTNVTASDFAFM